MTATNHGNSIPLAAPTNDHGQAHHPADAEDDVDADDSAAPTGAAAPTRDETRSLAERGEGDWPSPDESARRKDLNARGMHSRIVAKMYDSSSPDIPLDECERLAVHVQDLVQERTALTAALRLADCHKAIVVAALLFEEATEYARTWGEPSKWRWSEAMAGTYTMLRTALTAAATPAASPAGRAPARAGTTPEETEQLIGLIDAGIGWEGETATKATAALATLRAYIASLRAEVSRLSARPAAQQQQDQPQEQD